MIIVLQMPRLQKTPKIPKASEHAKPPVSAHLKKWAETGGFAQY